MTLPTQLIDTLVDLVDTRLLSLSSSRQDGSAEYQHLQACRHSLLALATGVQSQPSGPVPGRRFGHLTALPGGKA